MFSVLLGLLPLSLFYRLAGSLLSSPLACQHAARWLACSLALAAASCLAAWLLGWLAAGLLAVWLVPERLHRPQKPFSCFGGVLLHS